MIYKKNMEEILLKGVQPKLPVAQLLSLIELGLDQLFLWTTGTDCAPLLVLYEIFVKNGQTKKKKKLVSFFSMWYIAFCCNK
jgi:hypothetical protein